MYTEQDMLRQQLEQQEKHNKSVKKNMFAMRIVFACIALAFFLPMTGWFASSDTQPVQDDYIYEETYETYY